MVLRASPGVPGLLRASLGGPRMSSGRSRGLGNPQRVLLGHGDPFRWPLGMCVPTLTWSKALEMKRSKDHNQVLKTVSKPFVASRPRFARSGGWTVGRVDGQSVGRMHGRSAGQTVGRADGFPGSKGSLSPAFKGKHISL